MSAPGQSASSPEQDWQRRPVRSAVVQCLRLLGVAAAVLFAFLRDTITDWLEGEPLDFSFATVVAGLVLAGNALGLIGTLMSWWRFGYRVDDAGLHVRSGMLSTTTSTFAPTRIDTISVDEPLIQRLAGLVTLRVEVSGGADSNATIEYLPRVEADRLQAELVALRERSRPGKSTDEGLADTRTAVGDPEEPTRPSDERQPLLALDADRARRYLLCSPGLWVMALGAVLVLIAGGVDWALEGLEGAVRWAVIGLGLGTAAVRQAASRWREAATWRVDADRTGIEISHGRLHRTRTRIRTARVSALKLEQGPIRRRLGWWRVTVTVSALGAGSSEDTSNLVCAIATPEEIGRLLPHLLPDLPEETAGELAVGGAETTAPPHWVRCAPVARWWSPLGWRSEGMLLNPQHVLTRTGRWDRTVNLLARRTLQTVSTMAGPFDRRAGVATLQMAMVPGPTSSTAMSHLPAAVAERLRDEVALSRPR